MDLKHCKQRPHLCLVWVPSCEGWLGLVSCSSAAWDVLFTASANELSERLVGPKQGAGVLILMRSSVAVAEKHL